MESCFGCDKFRDAEMLKSYFRKQNTDDVELQQWGCRVTTGPVNSKRANAKEALQDAN